jgi:hypothetical protein
MGLFKRLASVANRSKMRNLPILSVCSPRAVTRSSAKTARAKPGKTLLRRIARWTHISQGQAARLHDQANRYVETLRQDRNTPVLGGP